MISFPAAIIATILFAYLLFVIVKYRDFRLQAMTTMMMIAMAFLFLIIVITLSGNAKPLNWTYLENIINPLPEKMEVLSDYFYDGTLHVWLLDPRNNTPIYYSMPDPGKKRNTKLQKEKAAGEERGVPIFYKFKSNNQAEGGSQDKKGDNSGDGKDGEGDATMGNFEAEINSKSAPLKSFIISPPPNNVEPPPHGGF